MKDRTLYLRLRSAATFGVVSTLLVFSPWVQTANAQEAPTDDQAPAITSNDQPSGAPAEVDPWAGVEEMLVTGTGSAGLLKDIAQANSVTSFDDEALQAIGAGDISDLAAYTPNLEIVTAGSTSPTFFIRGIGLNDFSSNAAGAVAIYQDDVAVNSPSLQLGSLFDIGNVAVLRGPQGSRGFRNASAGAIRTSSRLPSGDFGANASIDYGNYNLMDLQGGLEFPVIQDALSGRVAFRLRRRGGYIKNRCARAQDFGLRPVRDTPFPRDPRFSICGEEVPRPSFAFRGISEVEPFQRSHLNQENQFSARGILRFTPDLAGDVETEWLLILRGSRIDQPSTVGSAIGTGGITAFPETGAPNIVGLYGGINDQSYQDTDITQELDRVIARVLLNAPGTPVNTARQIARRATAQQIARDLDPDPFTGAYSHTGMTRNETFGVSLKGDTTFNDEYNVTLVLGYDRWKRHVDVDLDFSPNTGFETETNDRGKQIYADLIVAKTFFEDLNSDWAGPLDWEVGAFGLIEELDSRVDVNFGFLSGLAAAPRTRLYNQTVESFAGFMHMSWDLLEVFTLDGGFRFNWERRGIDYILFNGAGNLKDNSQFTGSEPTGTVRLTYNPTADIDLYAKYTRGWKGGTFNATGDNNLGVSNAAAETIDAFEIGTHQSFLDSRVKLYASFFHYSYQNYQLFTSQQGFLAPPAFVILNAEDVELYGSEVELEISPWEGGEIDFKFAWLEGEFLEFVQNQVNTRQVGTQSVTIVREIDRSGNALLNAPNFTINLALQQSFPLGKVGFLTARWDGAWKDDTFFDASEGRGIPNSDEIEFFPELALGQGAYWVHNLRLTYATVDSGFAISGWVRNVGDEVYRTFAADLSTFQQTTLNFVGEPRTYGMTVALKF